MWLNVKNFIIPEGLTSNFMSKFALLVGGKLPSMLRVVIVLFRQRNDQL
jgi:hypothetical protein